MTTVVLLELRVRSATPSARGCRLKPDFDLVGEANDEACAVRITGKLRPDVVLVDLVADDLDVSALVKEIGTAGLRSVPV